MRSTLNECWDHSGKHSGLDIKFASCFILFILFLRKPELGQGSGVEWSGVEWREVEGGVAESRYYRCRETAMCWPSSFYLFSSLGRSKCMLTDCCNQVF